VLINILHGSAAAETA